MIDALSLVFVRRNALVTTAVLFVLVTLLYAWAGQVLIVGPDGVSILIEPTIIAAAVILGLLFAISIPLQVYALRMAALESRSAGGSVLGLLVGTASMSCCAPVLLPAVLSLVGFSGTAILSVNLTIHRYFVPLALLGAMLLGYSIISTAASLGRTCMVGTRT